MSNNLKNRVNINDSRQLDLDASGTGANHVFSAYGKTTINFNNLAENGVFNATNKTEIPNIAWQGATFQVVQASAQAGIVQTGAISSTNDIQTKFVLADTKRVTITEVAKISQKAVKELFTNNVATDIIKDTTTQATIDAAQKLIDAVTDLAVKAALQNRAQELLNERLAKARTITSATYSLATDKNITGTYTEDVTKITVTVGDKVYKGGTVANGTFTFYAFDKIKNTTDPVTIHAYDAAGKLLDTKTLKVVTGVPAVTKGSITPLEMAVPGDKNITGTYTGEVKSVQVTVNGTTYKGGTFTDGEFKFYSFDKVKSVTDEVIIVALDKAGNVLDTKTIEVVK
ncbi:hypothetical protein HB904_10315 [Listeria booriae]|uniref:Bacterial Ig domain-containing protein n=1 Tax=Listeria booriae TaxID=1552123 RepID=A0A842AIA4_9LIST|nr:immunoglobulin-like domain-containing protein [Listeria booriae]MBC1400737.1 hypothetical protein [Listeria booriae]MBC1616584.1 hypothetical protein [Listeria booriae]